MIIVKRPLVLIATFSFSKGIEFSEKMDWNSSTNYYINYTLLYRGSECGFFVVYIISNTIRLSRL